MYGAKVYSNEAINFQINSSSTLNQVQGQIDLSDQPSGVYILKIKTEKGMAIRKFVKE